MGNKSNTVGSVYLCWIVVLLWSYLSNAQAITSFTTVGTFEQYVPVVLSNVTQNGIKEITIYRNDIHENRNWLAHGSITIHSIGYGWGSGGNSIKLENSMYGKENIDNTGAVISPLGRVVCDWSANNIVVFLRGGATYRTDATVVQNTGVFVDAARTQNFSAVSIKDADYNIPKGTYYSEFEINAKNSIFCALASGNIGIGTATPTARLEVAGLEQENQVYKDKDEMISKALVVNIGSFVKNSNRRLFTFTDIPKNNFTDAQTWFGIEDRNDMNRLRHHAYVNSWSEFIIHDRAQKPVFSVYENNESAILDLPKPDSYISVGAKSVWPIPHKLWVHSGTSKFDNDVYVDTKVGIGTTAPEGKLHVGDNSKAGIVINNRITLVANQIPAQLAWAESGSLGQAGDLIISPRTDISASVKIYTNDGTTTSERFRISGKGDAALQGKFEAKELKVTTTPTADFVFDETYTLPQLEAVEKHIKEKKHLPEIASAKEMEKNGVNVGDFQIKLLQKIEELTLYVIEQNKKIQALQTEIKELKK